MKTQAALAAKSMKKELKKYYPNTKFSVTSSNYSMGDSVTVDWKDGPEQKEVSKLISKYQYGHFDGRDDTYNYSNKRTDIPQTQCVFTTRRKSGAQNNENH